MSDLCQRCALCCDGELFAAVPLTPRDDAAARARGLALARDGATSLRQPCPALRDRRCTIYDDRPDACRRYRCMLLIALDAGEVSLPEALDVVAEARARLAALAAEAPGDGPVLSRARAAARSGDMSPGTHTVLARAAAFLERRFRGHTRR